MAKQHKEKNVTEVFSKPSRKEAEEAVKTLIKWAGDNPEREGLLETPHRVAKAFNEWFRGYGEDPKAILGKTFKEVEEYCHPVSLNQIPFESYCEHHIAPIVGHVNISYIPNGQVVGISKLARLVDLYSKRLQVQEKMTSQIAQAIQKYLKPNGVAVRVEGDHHCMCTRGVNKKGISMVTTTFLGDFSKNLALREEFVSNAKK